MILKQTLEPKASLVAPIILDGDYVSLGPFEDIVYNHNIENELKIGLKALLNMRALISPLRPFRKLFEKHKSKELHVVISIAVNYSIEQKRMILSGMCLSSELFDLRFYPPKMNVEGKIL